MVLGLRWPCVHHSVQRIPQVTPAPVVLFTGIGGTCSVWFTLSFFLCSLPWPFPFRCFLLMVSVSFSGSPFIDVSFVCLSRSLLVFACTPFSIHRASLWPSLQHQLQYPPKRLCPSGGGWYPSPLCICSLPFSHFLCLLLSPLFTVTFLRLEKPLPNTRGDHRDGTKRAFVDSVAHWRQAVRNATGETNVVSDFTPRSLLISSVLLHAHAHGETLVQGEVALATHMRRISRLSTSDAISLARIVRNSCCPQHSRQIGVSFFFVPVESTHEAWEGGDPFARKRRVQSTARESITRRLQIDTASRAASERDLQSVPESRAQFGLSLLLLARESG